MASMQEQKDREAAEVARQPAEELERSADEAAVARRAQEELAKEPAHRPTGILGAIQGGTASILKAVTGKAQETTEKAKETKDATAEKASEYADSAAQKAKETKDATAEKAREYTDAAAQKAKDAKDSALEKGREVKDSTAQKMEEYRETAKEKAGETKDAVAGKIGAYKDTAAEKARETKDAAAGKMEEYKQRMGETKNAASEKVRESKDATAEKAREYKDTAAQKAQEYKDAAIGTKEEAKEKTRRWNGTDRRAGKLPRKQRRRWVAGLTSSRKALKRGTFCAPTLLLPLDSLLRSMVFSLEFGVIRGPSRTAEAKGSIFSAIGGVAGAIKEKLTGGKEEAGQVGKRGDEGEDAAVAAKPDQLRPEHVHGEVQEVAVVEKGGAGEGLVHAIVEAARDAVGGEKTTEEKVPKM
ncbi:Embryonic protein DC-8 [Nymphaea thermarum]|nr:Embryonic protein DC-8 [Nymphaea thermarum]